MEGGGISTSMGKQHPESDMPLQGVTAVCTETTDQTLDDRRLEAEIVRLRQSEAWLRSISDNLPGYVWGADPTGALDFTTQAWLDYAGTTESGTLGGGWSQFVHPDDLVRVTQAWMHSVGTGERYDIEFRCRRHDGQFRWFLVRAAAIRNEAGGIERWVGMNVDVEDQKRAEAALFALNTTLEQRVADATAAREQMEGALRQAQKMEAIGQLTGGIAHDFNNMLQSILGSLDLTRRRLKQGRADEVDRLLEMATQGATRAATLTSRLLSFARRQALAPRPLDANALVTGMAELVRNTVGKAVQVEIDLSPGLPLVRCDANQMESALLNLAINARDAMPHGGSLRLGTEAVMVTAADVAGHPGVDPGPFVQLSITDTGTGMPEEVAARAFEPFYTTKPLGQGTGLGLSQLYGFVRQSGGLVQLRTASGQGTQVRLLLPRFDGSLIDEAEPPETVMAPRRGGNILLVEDEDAVRSLAREALTEQGWRVLEATTGPDALALLRDGAAIEVLVTDVGLPGGMSGQQMVEFARRFRPTLRVLFITGHAQAALTQDPLSPHTRVIAKPFRLPVLIAAVAEMLGAERPE